MLKDMTHRRARPVQQVHVSRWHPALDQQAHELLDNNADLPVNMEQRLVAHIEGSHELEDRNFERKVERRDEGNRPVRPAHSSGRLAGVVSRDSKATREKADLNTCALCSSWLATRLHYWGPGQGRQSLSGTATVVAGSEP